MRGNNIDLIQKTKLETKCKKKCLRRVKISSENGIKPY